MNYAPANAQLKTGDLIAVAYSNYFQIAIFRDYGKVGNVRFWFPYHIIGRDEEYEKWGGTFKLFVSHINSDAGNRVFRITEDNLDANKLQDIEKCYQILIKHGIIKREDYEIRKQQARLYQRILRGDYKDVDFS